MTDNSLTLSANLDSLKILEDFVLRRIEPLALSADCIQDIRLVLEELFANIVFYAYPEGPGVVHVECSVDSKRLLCIRLRDSGIPFNPLKCPEPDLDRDFTERKIGGLGIHLVKQIAHKIRYAREDGSNILTVCFQF